jgi:phosphatidylethanolamine-binding protein (PEBP) family uncharacterized protein
MTKSAGTTSARIFLALVVAVLVLGGCGGGSSDTSSSSSSTADASGSPSAGSSGNASDPSANPGSGAGGSSASAGGNPPGPGAQGGGGEGSGGNHGPPIAQPTGEPEPGITPQQRQEATVASMTLESPSGQPSSSGSPTLPVTYTCDGRGTSPALRWQGVPQGTAELILFVMNVQPVGGKLFFDWAVAGLSPELEEIEAGKLPTGTVVGRNSFGRAGYEICPEGAETYVFALFALPKKLSAASGFDPAALRKEVLDSSGNVGLLALSYARG